MTISLSDEPALLHRSLAERPHRVARASGSYLYLEDGRAILDACGGAAVTIIGHGNEEVTQAAVEQMRRVSYVHTVTYTTDAAEDLARCVIEPSEKGFEHGLVRAFFVGSGSEANDTAMKCARQYWFEKGQPQRKYFVSRNMGYHGNTLGAMSVSAIAARKVPYNDILLPNVSTVSAADGYHTRRQGETDSALSLRLITELEEEFLRLGPENIISFIAEPVVGAASGATPAPKGYFTAVRALCDRYDILLHLDEIMCGMGRTGTYFAFEHEAIQPDIVTIGKGLGGGYSPIGGMLINRKIVESLRQGSSVFNNGQTYQAHPVSCAIALSVQRILRRDKLVARVASLGPTLEKMLRDVFEGCRYVADIRGRGFFWGIVFMLDTENKVPFPAEWNFGLRVQQKAFDLGVAIYPGAGDFVLICPSYTVTEEELDISVKTTRKAYDEVAAAYKER